jgi:hypothetical protein
MRGLLVPFAVLAFALPGVASADGGCPAKATPDVLTAFGEPAATLKGGQVIYQPAGVTMLGMPVSYVVVTKGAGDAVQEIDYRFAGLTRKYGQHFPQPVLQAFDKAYDGATCADGKVTSCGIGLDGKATGDLTAAQINEAYIDLPAKADGALAMVKADFSSQTEGPVFLTCQYN